MNALYNWSCFMLTLAGILVTGATAIPTDKVQAVSHQVMTESIVEWKSVSYDFKELPRDIESARQEITSAWKTFSARVAGEARTVKHDIDYKRGRG